MFNVALFGAGRIGQIHAGNAAAHPDLKLKFIVDPSRAAADALAQRTGAAVVDLNAALGDASVSAVIIASSTNAHLEQVLAAAAAGKAIFCEKPLDLDLARARRAAPRLETAVLLMGFNRRFDHHFQALKSRLDAGAIGRLESLSIISHDPAPPPIEYVRVSGGLFKDMTIHDFDVARWMLGEEPTSVYATASNLVDPAIGAAGDVDMAKIVLKTASGRMGVISNTRRSGYGYDQRVELYGSKGRLAAGNMTETTVESWTERGAAADRFENFFLTRYAAAYRAEADHFAAILAGKAKPLVGIADGVDALRLAVAAGRSAQEGVVVEP